MFFYFQDLCQNLKKFPGLKEAVLKFCYLFQLLLVKQSS